MILLLADGRREKYYTVALQRLQLVSSCCCHSFPEWPAMLHVTPQSVHLICFFIMSYLIWRPGLTHHFTQTRFYCPPPLSLCVSLPHSRPPFLSLSSELGFLTPASFYIFIFFFPSKPFKLGPSVLLSLTPPPLPSSLPPSLLFAMLAHI